MRTPSDGPRRTSVDRPRIVEVTGALMNDWSNRPIGSRLRTTMGRTLSRRASQTSPRRGDLSVVFAVGIEGLPVRVISQCTRIRQGGNGRFRIRGRNSTVGGDVPTQPLGINQAVEGQVDDLGRRTRGQEGTGTVCLRPVKRNSHLLLRHT